MTTDTPSSATPPATTYIPHPAPKILIVGTSGRGKTHALGSLIKAGITPFILFTEPHQDVLLRYLKINNIDESDGYKVHWHYVPMASQSWDDMLKDLTKINSMTYKQMSQSDDINKKTHNAFLEFNTALGGFVSDRDGVNYGDTRKWNTDRALVIDTLSGMSAMMMDLVVGSKPVVSPGEWNIAMSRLERVVNTLVTALNCWVIVNAHLEREKDEITGAIKNMPAVLGSKLPPKIPRFFTDVIEAYVKDDQFRWRTKSSDTDLKSHHLPLFKNDIVQDYGAFVKAFQEAGGQILPTES